MKKVTSCWAIIPAAGKGSRMGSDMPKQYMKLGGMTMLEHSAACLINDSRILGVTLVVDLETELLLDLPILKDNKVAIVQGGAERSDSVLAGLAHLSNKADETDWVLVHDAARPCVHEDEIQRLIEVVSDSGIGGVLAQRISDTLKRGDDERFVVETIRRDGLWRALTPQMFCLGLLREALLAAKKSNVAVTDEASAMEWMGHPVQLVPGFSTNIKVTVSSDIEFARLFLKASNQVQASVSERD